MERDSAQEQYDKMTKTPVHQLVLRLGLPTTVSMLVTSIYNMADTFFVSQLGTSVSGATGVVFALMAIINAFGFMFGHGAGSNISRKLGAHDVESARVFASTSFFLSLLAGSVHWRVWLFISCTLHAASGQHGFYSAPRHRVQYLDPYCGSGHGLQLCHEQHSPV